MTPIKLSKENEQRKKTLKRKRNKTENEQKELRILSGKIARPENEYMEDYRALMAQRPGFQKKFNQYYPPRKNIPTYSTSIYVPQGLGIYQHPDDTRDTLNEAALRIPNNNIPEPAPIELNTEDVAQAYVSGNVDKKPLLLESQAEVELRTVPYLFGLWFTKKTGEESPFERIEDVPDDIFHEFQTDIINNEENPDNFELLFGLSETELKKFIENHEIGSPSERVQTKEIGQKERRFLTKLVNSQVVLPNGSSEIITKVSVPGAIHPSRYLASLKKGKKYMIYHIDFNKYRCGIPLPEDIEKIKPLTTLKSNGCISIFNGKKSVLYFMNQKIPADYLFKNWIVLREEFSPVSSTTEKVIASKLMLCSFFQDAMNNWGIIGMDASFYRLCKTKYPEILYKNSSYFVKDKEFARFYETVFRPDMKENFLVFDSKFYTRKYEVSLENPFVNYEANELHEAFDKALDQNYVYGMTPYMAYLWKKQNPELWKKFLFEGTNPNKHTRLWKQSILQETLLYSQLNEREKIIIDYLQFLRFLEVLQEEYNFRKARDTYRDLLSDASIKQELLELYTEENPNNRVMMRHLQDSVSPHMRPADLGMFHMRRAEIGTILNKFNLTVRLGAAASNNENAVVNVRPRASERPILSLRAPAPRNELTQLRSRIQQLKEERNVLLRNPIVFNAASTTRKNRAAVNKMYANQLKRLGFFSRFTKAQQRKQLQLNQAAARKAFQNLNALNRNIQQLEQEVARRYPRLPQSPAPSGNAVTPPPANTPPANGAPPLPASPGSSAGTARSSASTASLPAYPPAAGVLGNL